MKAGEIIWSLMVVALFGKMVALAMVQGVVRMRGKHFTKPEDATYFGNGTVSETEHPTVALAQAALRNDLENIPIALGLTWAYIITDGPVWLLAIYAVVFVMARAVHSLAYLRPTQPLRNRAYVVGLAVCLALAAQVIWGAGHALITLFILRAG